MKTTSTHLPSLLGLLLFVTGAVILLGVSLVLAVLTLGSLFTGREVQVRDTILLAVSACEGVLLLAAAFVALQKLRGQPGADFESAISIRGWQMAACLLAAGAAIRGRTASGRNSLVNRCKCKKKQNKKGRLNLIGGPSTGCLEGEGSTPGGSFTL